MQQDFRERYINFYKKLLEKPQIMEEEIFTHLFEQAEIAKFSKKELHEYEESLKAYRDWYSVTKTSFDKGKAEGLQEGIERGIEQGKAEGIEQGRAEGIEQGRAEGIEQGKAEGLQEGIERGIEQGKAEGIEQGKAESRTEAAINLLKMGVDIHTIAGALGLSIDDINKLR